MARADLITVAQMAETLRNALAVLERMDQTKPINLNAGNDQADQDETVGFVTRFGMSIEPSMDEEELDVNVDINWTEAV